MADQQTPTIDPLDHLHADQRALVEGFKLKAAEKNDVHVVLEVVEFDAQTGKKLSRPFTQIYDPTSWAQFLDNRAVTGATIIHVNHLPKGAKSVEQWEAEQAAKQRKEAASRITVKAV